MNTQTRDAEFGFNRTKGNLYSLIDEVGAKMQKDLDSFLNVSPKTEHVRLEEVISRTSNGRRHGKRFHTCRLFNRAEHSIRQTS